MKQVKVEFQTKDEWYGDIYRCCGCKMYGIWRRFKYCPYCGKEIDWERVEE